MRRLAVLLICASLLCGGCMAARPAMFYTITDTQAAQMDFGPYPDQWQIVLKEYLDETLKDPASAKIDYGNAPVKVTVDGINEPPVYGYGGTIRVNAKNVYGGYTGWQTYTYIIWHDMVYVFDHRRVNIHTQPMPQGCPVQSATYHHTRRVD